ncbi:hypothetical protein OL548_09790 [Lysinibacillus sp. MHQ-1]|nr:hypothetical protein OL548_09790 [Lysinibacillus sp. MHQ-1]
MERLFGKEFFLRLPSIVIAVAKNQVEVAKAVSSTGAIMYLGISNEIIYNQVLTNIELLYKNSDELGRMRNCCENLIS